VIIAGTGKSSKSTEVTSGKPIISAVEWPRASRMKCSEA